MTKQIVAGPQGLLAVETVGNDGDSPVIFIHSDMGNREQWLATMDRIADKHYAIAFDRRGHGESEVPRNGDYSIDNTADDVIAVADSLSLDRFVLVGHSGGGAIAFVCAAKNPERVAALLLVDPAPDPSALPPGMLKSQLAAMEGKDYEKTLTEYYGTLAGPNQRLKDRIVATARATPKETGIGTLKAFIGFHPRDYAGRYQGPGLAIIQSHFDMPYALHRIGAFDHRSIDGVGHWLQLGAPEKFYGMLDEFLDQVENVPRISRRPEVGESTSAR